jgi:hypothetical protein
MASSGPPYAIEHPITAADAVEAARLARRTMMRVGKAIGAVVMAIGIVALVLFDWFIGVTVLAVGGATLGTATLPHLDRWLAGQQLRGVVGGRARSVIDADGINFENPQISGRIAWSSLTHLLENDRVLVLMRDRALVAYIPTSALGASRDEIVAFMRDRIAPTGPDSVAVGGRTV